MLPVITVVMPVYNGEHFLRETLDSIIGQTLKQFTVLCINDFSVDNSEEILKEYECKDKRFRVISTSHNLGDASKVIAHHKDLIVTPYFIYTSQDDTFAKDWLEKLYLKATQTSADAVIPRVHCIYNDNGYRDTYFHGVSGNLDAVLTGRQAFELSVKWEIAANALWKTSLLRKYGYYNFSFNADEYTARVYFLHSTRVVFADTVFFYRQNNEDAITKKFSKKWFLSPLTEFYLWRLSVDHGLEKSLQHFLIRRGVRQVLYYYPYTFIPTYRDGRASLKACLEECRRVGILDYLNANRSRELLVEWCVLRSSLARFIISFLVLMKNANQFIKILLIITRRPSV